MNDIAFDIEFDQITAAQIRELNSQKMKAVEIEDFDEAKRLKIAIDSLKQVSIFAKFFKDFIIFL